MHKWSVLTRFALVGISVFAVRIPAPAQNTFPEGKGKVEFQRICGNCHDLATAVQTKRTRDQWASVIDDMQARGATGTDLEISRMVDYLATNYGKQDEKK